MNVEPVGWHSICVLSYCWGSIAIFKSARHQRQLRSRCFTRSKIGSGNFSYLHETQVFRVVHAAHFCPHCPAGTLSPTATPLPVVGRFQELLPPCSLPWPRGWPSVLSPP